jgi:hypothetical protein
VSSSPGLARARYGLGASAVSQIHQGYVDKHSQNFSPLDGVAASAARCRPAFTQSDNSSNSALTSLRSTVSNPSVNQRNATSASSGT